MKSYVFLVLVAVSASVMSLGSSQAAEKPKKYNILFIMDDQHRGDSVGAAGAKWLRTPHLDKLAKEGVMFNRAYSTTPACLPARAAILTGMRPWNHGLLSFLAIPDQYRYEFPRILANSGYRTHAVGKNHFYGAKHGYQTTVLEEFDKRRTDEGLYYDDYMRWMQINHPSLDPAGEASSFTDHRGNRPWPYKESTHPTHWTAEMAKRFLREYNGENPWMLKVSFHRPHPPFDPPKRLLDYYLKVAKPTPFKGEWSDKQFSQYTGSLYRTPNMAVAKFPDAETNESRAAYYALIEHVDEKIGEVIKALKKRGEYDNTLILFTSDHGDMMGDHHLWRKTYAYEGSARIPMIIKWPKGFQAKMQPGSTAENLVEMRDIFPTFLDAAGVKIPEQIDGESMLKIVRDPETKWRDFIELEHGSGYFSETAYVSLVGERYKYIRFLQTDEEQLFDLKNDPQESTLITEKKLLKQWRQKLVHFLAERGDGWVKDGKIVRQTKRMRYSPNLEKFALIKAPPAVESRFNPAVEPLPFAEYMKKINEIHPSAIPGASCLPK